MPVLAATTFTLLAVVPASACTLVAGGAQSRPVAGECAEEPRLHALDFWIGRWTVSQQGRRVGSNLIESIQQGCAVIEQWTDGGGGTGFSLFYFDRDRRLWKQVWVTGRALHAGGQKEKTEIPAFTTASQIRFQGSYADEEGADTILDRTTLVLNADGTVRQRIEISVDDGVRWTTTFDALYRRVVASPE